MHIAWGNGDPMVFFQKGHQWMGLSNAGTPYIHLVAVDHSDNGALQWKLRVDTGENEGHLIAVEQQIPWIDITDRVPDARLSSKVSTFELRTFYTAKGTIACKWRVNKKYVYDDAQISTKTRNAVLDTMLKPMH